MKRHKLITLFFFLVISFVYGAGVGIYKWFPFDIVQSAKRKLEIATVGRLEFLSIAARNDILKFDSKRKEVACPASTDGTGVIVSLGQSNAANSASYLYSPDEVPNVINWYDGRCYRAQSPLLGATGSKGEWISRTAQFLVENGTYDNVIVLSLGVGSSPIAAWTSGSKLNDRLLQNLKNIGNLYNVTDLIWHQGETDLLWGVGQSQYYNSFLNLKHSIRSAGIDAPIFMSIASYCNGGVYPNSITMAQMELVEKIDGIELGVNTDLMITPQMRHDNCHFNLTGQDAAASELASLIASFHKTS
ncbi:sialate O-acetylesterase [Kordiimonas aquimaris]|uniref:sialate O-acetylesterase n=1 Tax=Kordiimonas aquimaris TaxID=707591 RepID=UPI0021D17E32|nr:sialate O-acetylesterase [Kordiimonas aquimaris]